MELIINVVNNVMYNILLLLPIDYHDINTDILVIIKQTNAIIIKIQYSEIREIHS